MTTARRFPARRAGARIRARGLGLARRSPRTLRLLHGVARRLAGGHRVGALAVVVDDSARVLVARHVVGRSSWALPGGWVRPFEDPAAAVTREVAEETGLEIVPVAIVASEHHGPRSRRLLPPPSGISLAYLCRPTDLPQNGLDRLSDELIEAAWVPAVDVGARLSRFDAIAVAEAMTRLAPLR